MRLIGFTNLTPEFPQLKKAKHDAKQRRIQISDPPSFLVYIATDQCAEVLSEAIFE